MAIPIIMRGNSGSTKKGERQGLLTSPLDPPVAGGGEGGWVLYICRSIYM